MPLPIAIARAIINKLVEERKSGRIKWLRPDAKSQVSVKYENDKPVGIHTVIVSTQHDPMEHKTIFDVVLTHIIKPVLKSYGYDTEGVRVLVNPTGNFVLGGPAGDSGVTGRKIIVDTYGGYFSHGGGAFSGKDPTKVDRSSAYAVRHIAKNIVSAGLADKCQVQISYAIGVAEPISLNIETYGTEKVAKDKLLAAVKSLFDLTPKAIIKRYNLKDAKGIKYQDLAEKGHFGRVDRELPWEKLDMVDRLKAAVK
jgi:S-adenosylmethionine synthetase